MPPLEPPDSHLVNAVSGWLQLGNAAEARAEFNQIHLAVRNHPQVLEVEWQLLAGERRWLAAADLGERLVQACPNQARAWVHRSFALHELRRTREAFDLLLPAAGRFPRESLIPYNLACYTCQLGDLPAARRWLERALGLHDATEHKLARLRSAVEDEDLKQLWPELRERIATLEA